MFSNFFDVFNLDLLFSGIRLATPLILAAMGGVLCSSSGLFDLTLEGKILGGAFVAIMATYFLQNTYLGILVALIFGVLFGLTFAFLYHRYHVNLFILAIALNLIIASLVVYLLRIMFGVSGAWTDPSIVQLPYIEIPILKDIPIIGPIITGHNLITYIALIVTILVYFVLFHTKIGFHIRAVGENKEAAETVGINSTAIQKLVCVATGILACLGGAFLSVGHLSLFTINLSAGRGFTALTAVIFGRNHPIPTFIAALFFGITQAFAIRVQPYTTIAPSLIQILPNFAPLAVLIYVGVSDKIRKSKARRRFRSKLLSELIQ